MTTYAELVDYKMSNALQAMIDGLLEMDPREGQAIRMSDFGYVASDGICYGCAATATIQKLVRPLTSEEFHSRGLRAQAFNKDYDDQADFEDAIDCARVGFLGYLNAYLGEPLHRYDDCLQQDWSLTSVNFRDHLPEIKTLVDELRSRGL